MPKFCLNTSTIRGYGLSLPDQVEVAARAGYDAIEPWISDLQAFADGGGSLEELGREIRSRSLSVQGAIGFFEWCVDEDDRRSEALEQARRDMELVVRLGGGLIAAPPKGAVETGGLELLAIAERYHVLCEVGTEFGVRPMVEVWGFSRTLGRLGEAAFVAIESGHSNACVLADVYHLYKGGSPIEGLGLLAGERLPLFHINDYPGGLSREAITDSDRVWPGDGVAPLQQIYALLNRVGFDGYLSLELFNPEYWKGDAPETARLGLEKARAAFGAAPVNSI